MEVSTVGAAVGVPRTTRARGLDGMKSEDFFKILVTEMQNQDPFEPAKTADMIAQVSQIRTIEQSAKLNDTLDLLTQQQRIGGSGELIGKFVQAISVGDDGSATYHEGVVTAVRFTGDGQALLELDTGEVVPVAHVVRIMSLSEAEATVVEDYPPADPDEASGESETA